MLLARIGLPLVSQQLPAPAPAFVKVSALWISRPRWLLGWRRWQLMPALPLALVLVSPPELDLQRLLMPALGPALPLMALVA